MVFSRVPFGCGRASKRRDLGRLSILALVGASVWLVDPGVARAESEPAKAAASAAEGEKNYQLQVIEVEGRLRTPQILYFLRRARAELNVERLGHRSFLPELGDTRRSSALR